jgi:hypothetical protein
MHLERALHQLSPAWPRIAFIEHQPMWNLWLKSHLDSMYSDYEFRRSNSQTDNLRLKFKKSILSVFEHIAKADVWQAMMFGVGPSDKSKKDGDGCLDVYCH